MKKRTKIIALVMLLGAILFILSSVWKGNSATGKVTTPTVTSTVTILAPTGDATDKPKSTAAGPAHDRQTVRKIYKENKKNLVLVNEENKLKKKDSPTLIPICYGRLHASEALYDSLVRMLADARKEGYQYYIASAYRSSEKQQKLVDDGVRKRMRMGLPYEEALAETRQVIMPAGHSEHETGLALDILCTGNMQMDETQKWEPGNIWLQKNCHKYGFILRYPDNKEHITGITYEPWHFRYVGERAATYMREENITLEEFWQRLEK